MDSRSVAVKKVGLGNIDAENNSFLIAAEGIAISKSEGTKTNYNFDVIELKSTPEGFGSVLLAGAEGNSIFSVLFSPECRFQNQNLLNKLATKYPD